MIERSIPDSRRDGRVIAGQSSTWRAAYGCAPCRDHAKRRGRTPRTGGVVANRKTRDVEEIIARGRRSFPRCPSCGTTRSSGHHERRTMPHWGGVFIHRWVQVPRSPRIGGLPDRDAETHGAFDNFNWTPNQLTSRAAPGGFWRHHRLRRLYRRGDPHQPAGIE